MAIKTWLAQFRRRMRRGWFARRVAQFGTARALHMLEHDAKTFARRRARRIPFPRLRFIFFPVGAANFALTEDDQRDIRNNYSWPSRLWAHLAPLLCITGALACMASVFSSVGFGILSVAYPVITMVVYLIMWLEENDKAAGLINIIDIRSGVADLCMQQAEESRQTFLAEDMTPLSLSVSELMGERLADLEVELLGPKSRFHETQSRIGTHHARALRLLERQKARVFQIDGETPMHLVTLRDATQSVVDRYAAALQKLDVFRASVGGYLDECHAQMRGLVAEVGDLEMAREVSAL